MSMVAKPHNAAAATAGAGRCFAAARCGLSSLRIFGPEKRSPLSPGLR